jgi:site-specific recombinase XerD
VDCIEHKKLAAFLTRIPRPVSPHIFRHKSSTHLLMSGNYVRTIKKNLGYKNVKTMMIYTRVYLKAVPSSLD